MSKVASTLNLFLDLTDLSEGRVRSAELESSLITNFSTLFGANGSQAVEQMQDHFSRGTSFPKEKVIEWVVDLSGEKTICLSIQALNAVRKIPHLLPYSRLILSAKGSKFIEANGRSEHFEQENRAAIHYFRECLELIFSRKRLAHAQIFFELQQMELQGSPLDKLTVLKVLRKLSDVQMSHVEETLMDMNVFTNAKNLDGSFQTAFLNLFFDDRVMLNRLETLSHLFQFQNVGELTTEQFQEVMHFINPLTNLHERMVGVARGYIESPSSECWSKIFHAFDWGHWLGKESTSTNQRLQLYSVVEELPGENLLEKWEGYVELLAKKVAYWELQEGMLLPAPADEMGITQYYKVIKEFVSGEGMVAYCLIRATPFMKSLPPILLFRGTSFSFSGLDAISNFMADGEGNLGKTSYEAGRDEIFDALGKLIKEDSQLVVIGYSFGGTMCQRFSHDFMRRKINGEFRDSSLEDLNLVELFVFNSPGVEKELAEEFAQQLASIEGLQVPTTFYKTQGDQVHEAGVCFIGSGCDRQKMPVSVVVCSGNLMTNPHETLFFDRSGVTIEERSIVRYGPDDEDLELLLTNEGHLFLENIRKIIGCVINLILRIIRFFVRLICGWRGADRIQRKTILNDVSSIYLAEVNSLLKLLDLVAKDRLEEGFAEWIECKMDLCLMDNQTAAECLASKGPTEFFSDLLFSTLTPVLAGSIDTFKEAIDFNPLCEKMADLLAIFLQNSVK